MTALRIIPLPIHAALEMVAGLALGIAPFALGLSTAATFLGVIAGAVMAISGDALAAGLFAFAAVTQLLLILATRYSSAR